MDYLQAFAISAAGMSVERTRVEVAARNLAHANTAHAPDAPAYQPMRALAVAGAGPSFVDLVDTGLAGAAALPTVTLAPVQGPARQVHDASHPLADEQGFVAYPAVDPAAEMVTLMDASRAYEANVAAMNTSRSLALKALDIGRRT